MARYAYDVNTSTRYIDVIRQFQGGLKTVDTDDSLGTSYLRDAKNVSISEFGFLEKRYGLFADSAVNPVSSGLVQGYFEYTKSDGTLHKLMLISGVFFLDTGTGFNEVARLWYDGAVPAYINNTDYATVGLEYISADSNFTYTFQTTRSIDGVRLDDKLYIMTGTYPVYYNGDGKIYLFTQYDLSTLDLKNLSYDLNSIDIAGSLLESDLSENTTHGPTYDGETVTIENPIIVKDYSVFPKVPDIGGTLKLEIAYHLYNNLAGTYWDTNFTSSGGITTTNGGSYGAYAVTSSTTYQVTVDKANYKIYPKVYKKISGANVSEYIPVEDITYVILTNDENTDVINSSLYDSMPLTSSATMSNMQISVGSSESGFWDYKVEMIIEKVGFYPSFGYSAPTVQSRTLFTKVVEISDVWVIPEPLTDYTEAPLDTLRVHQCNHISEHNGRLLAWGNPNFPDYLFFSEINAKNYFPYGYTIRFQNELGEGIQAINKFLNVLVVQTNNFTFGLKGSTPLVEEGFDYYQKIMINPAVGCIAPNSVKTIRNRLYFLSNEGIMALKALYAEDNRYNVDPIDRNIYNIVPRHNDAISAYFDNQYWLHFPQTGVTLRYYVEKNAWVMDKYEAWKDFGGIVKYINKQGDLRFITKFSQLNDGDPLKVYDVRVSYDLPTDLGKAVESIITTSYMNQGYPFHLKSFKEFKLDYTIQNEYNTGREPIVTTGVTVTSTYVLFTIPVLPRHTYQITFGKDEASSSYTIQSLTALGSPDGRISVSGDYVSASDQSWNPIQFTVPGDTTGSEIIKITSTFNTSNLTSSDIILYDATYDHRIIIKSVALSEEGTLNIDPIESYDQAEIEIPIDLGTRLGNWTFGNSEFGNVITAVKTVKLSGRGYNIKVNIQDISKSKWTLESIGITHKMKKARSG